LHGSELSSVTTPCSLKMEVADISNVAHLPDQHQKQNNVQS